MERKLCTNCGSDLIQKDGFFECPYCGARFAIDDGEKEAEAIRNALSDIKIEQLSNARRLLYDATHTRNPSLKKVHEAAAYVLAIHPEDVLAKFYEADADDDPAVLNAFLKDLSCEEALAKEIVRWSLLSLDSRNVGPLKNFVERNVEIETRLDVLTQIEDEADKLEEGLYSPSLPRDVFLCYSSSNMPEVLEVLDLLEDNGFTVFAAFRNLRHGKGAVENYLSAIHEALENCKVLVYLSSKSSRSIQRDALKDEITYVSRNLPKMKRVEYILQDYETYPPSLMARKLIKECFKGLEWCQDPEDLVQRVYDAINVKEEKSIACPKCGKKNPSSSHYCFSCGAPLHEEPKKKETPKPKAKVEESKWVDPDKPFRWLFVLICVAIPLGWPIAIAYTVLYLAAYYRKQKRINRK